MATARGRRTATLMVLALGLASALVAAAPASAETGIGHSVAWDFEGEALYQLDQLVRINTKAPTTYWAMQWAVERGQSSDDNGAYMGLQVGGTRPDGSMGEIAIFSMWSAKDGRAGEAGECSHFGHEGWGFSCRIAMDIVESRWYRYRTWPLETDATGTWWGAWVQDTVTGVDRHIGSIHSPFRDARILPGVVNFSEQWGPGGPWCEKVPPYSSASYAAPRTEPDGFGGYGRTAATRVLPDGTCTHEWVSDESFGPDVGDGVTIVLGEGGQPVEEPTGPEQPASPPRAPRPVDDSCPPDRIAEDGFTDVPGDSAHEAAIDCVVHWGLATGQTPTTYAPVADVSRQQMASFVARLIDRSVGTLPETDTDHFSDDDGSVHEHSINRLAAAGIVGGRSAGSYDPAGSLTRAQMAAFLTRAYDHIARSSGSSALPDGPDAFADDDGHTLEAEIDRSAAAGFTAGYPDGSYHPGLSLRRDQMASFLARALDLLVEDELALRP